MDTNVPSYQSIRTVASGRKSTSKALSVAFEDTGICNMQYAGHDCNAEEKVANEANKQLTELSTKKKEPKKTKQVEPDAKSWPTTDQAS